MVLALSHSFFFQKTKNKKKLISLAQEMMTSGTINLDPEYQRGTYFIFFFSELMALGSVPAVVWTTQKQESLIDSLYHNFYVPPIIFGEYESSLPNKRILTSFHKPATTTREDGIEIRTCIDGKQRLTSMRLYVTLS